jgi:hypothetical protein
MGSSKPQRRKPVALKPLLKERFRWLRFLLPVSVICAVLIQALLPRGAELVAGTMLIFVASVMVIGVYLKCLAVAGIPWTWRHDLVMFGIAIGSALAVSLPVYFLCWLPLSLPDCDTKPPVLLVVNLGMMLLFYAVGLWSKMRSIWREERRKFEKGGDPFKPD